MIYYKTERKGKGKKKKKKRKGKEKEKERKGKQKGKEKKNAKEKNNMPCFSICHVYLYRILFLSKHTQYFTC